ncbi:hypothetical protein [Rhodococcus sp. NPDC127528]|uniref:hypothetical protein n=1 Tax=unclassified Rhodococcus (in: high G+C Gram-positive bacteria) TaxID=192944 RepID=UPI0036262C06
MARRRRLSRGPEGSARANRWIETAAVASTSAFACGALLTQTVIVPAWRHMDPATFLSSFQVQGPVTGATLFPFELASATLLGISAYSATVHHRSGRLVWVLATAGMIGTFVLLPLYFVRADLAMLDPTFPPRAVSAELTSWNRWNWVRTGLGLTSAVLACVALAAGRDVHAVTADEAGEGTTST